MAAALFQQGLQQFIGSQKKKPGANRPLVPGPFEGLFYWRLNDLA